MGASRLREAFGNSGSETMFDFAWSEIAVIAAVALVVIGPKDLPRVLRAVGKWVGKARVVAREFQSSVDQMIREAELEEVRRNVEEVTRTDFGREIEKAVDPMGDIKQALAPPGAAETPRPGGPIDATPPAAVPLPAEPAPAHPEPAAAQPAHEAKSARSA